MGYFAVIFLVFSLTFSWFSGDKQKDELNIALEETKYEHKTMVKQVKQAKVKASLDASKMNDLTKKINKLAKDKTRVERKLERTRLRRSRLLRPQIIKIKEKVEAPYKVKLKNMEKAVKTAKVDLAKLRAENDKLKRQYRELIRKNRERLSEDDTLEKTPFTLEGTPGSAPVSQSSAPGTTPVSQSSTPGTTPVSQSSAPGTTPVSQSGAPGTTPVSQSSTPPFVLEEELVRLDNDELVRLEKIDRVSGIPASSDLVSAEEILKTADELPEYLRVEQIELKEGWL